MKILYILQQSIENGSKWLTADSNINMMVGIVDRLLKLDPSLDIDIVIAPVHEFADIKNYGEIYSHPRVNFIMCPTIINAFMNRQNFDARFFDALLTNEKYDIVWNNIIELSRNIKTILWFRKLKAKLVSCNYWLDAPMIGEEKIDKSVSYDWRQFDGAECSDLVAFTCPSTKQAFIDNAKAKFSGEYITKILNKSVIWDFGFSGEELKKYIPEHKEKPDALFSDLGEEIKLIIFPNRLSGINYTHHKEFIAAVNSLYEKRQDFRVVFTNPSQKVSWDELKASVKPLYIFKDRPLTREEYIRLLWRSNVVASLYTIERYGGCANVEAIMCGCYPVMPKFGEYINRAPDGYTFVNMDMSNLEECLNIALDKYKDITLVKFSDDVGVKIYRTSSYEMNGQKVLNDIKQLIGG